MTILTPALPVRFCIDRLRQSIAEPSRFSDQDLLDFINEGYKQAALKSRCFPVALEMTLPAGENTVPLPADHSQTIRVYQDGERLPRVSAMMAGSKSGGSYYQYAGTIGLTGASIASDLDFWIYYVSVPAPLGLDDAPAWGAEWNFLLRHYAAWRCYLASSGAQLAPRAVQEKGNFDIGVVALRRQSAMFVTPRGQRMLSPVMGTVIPVAR